MAVYIEYKLTGAEALTRMQVVNALKAALRRLGEYWFEAMLWKRFTPRGHTEYGFRVRTLKYSKAKLKYRGHNLPLVNSGQGKREAMNESTRARIRVTRDKVTIPLPRKFNRSNPKGPRMSEEIRAVSRAELQLLEENLVWYIDEELDAAVPPHLRNRGYIGGRASGVRFRKSGNPATRRAAA